MTHALGVLVAVVVLAANIQGRDAADAVVAQGMAELPTVAKTYADNGSEGIRREGICRERLEATREAVSVEIIRRDDNRIVGYRMPKDQPHSSPKWLEAETAKRGFKVLPKRWVIERTNGGICAGGASREIRTAHWRPPRAGCGWRPSRC